MPNVSNKSDYHMVSFGQYGSELISSGETGTEGETYAVVQCLESGFLVVEQVKGDESMTLPMVAGIAVYGKFTSVSSTSGTYIAYRG